MRHLLPQSANHPARSRAFQLVFSALLIAIAFASHPVQAQVVFDNFDDGDVSNVNAFFGAAANGGAGVGPTDDRNGTANSALSLGVNPGDGGGFAGAAVEVTPAVDASSAKYLTFFIRPVLQADNIPLTLEINLQEDANGDGAYDGATEDEYQANWRLSADNPTYQLVQIPLAAFTDDNSVNVGSDDGFDFTRVRNVVYAMGNVQGSAFNLSFDEIIFTEDRIETTMTDTPFDTFDDGDVSNVNAFFGAAANGGAGVGPTDDRNGTANSALSLGVNPGDGGGFAGAAVEVTPAVDASSAKYLTFFIRPVLQADNIPLTLEINLQEDANGDGAYDGATEDEYQANWRLSADNPTYQLVQIPLAAFTDDNSVNVGSDDGFDFSRVRNVVFAMGNVQGSPFNLSFDELAFDVGIIVSVEPGSPDLPDSYVLTDAYPNPFNPQARFELTLERPQDVSIAVYDMLGRKMEVLHSGVLPAKTRHAFQIDGQGWPSGLYWYRVTGESFSDTRSVVLLK